MKSRFWYRFLAYVFVGGKLTYSDFNQIQSWAFIIETQCRNYNFCKATEDLPKLEKLIKEATEVIQTKLASIRETINNKGPTTNK